MEDYRFRPPNNTNVIFVGIGDICDPLPHVEKKTKFWVYAGPCERCSSPARWIERGNFELSLKCCKCGMEYGIGLSPNVWENLTYVFWCKNPIFKSDLANLSPQVIAEINSIIAQTSEALEEPYLAVTVLAGICEKASVCASPNCPYLITPKPKKKNKTNIISITSSKKR